MDLLAKILVDNDVNARLHEPNGSSANPVGGGRFHAERRHAGRYNTGMGRAIKCVLRPGPRRRRARALALIIINQSDDTTQISNSYPCLSSKMLRNFCHYLSDLK